MRTRKPFHNARRRCPLPQASRLRSREPPCLSNYRRRAACVPGKLSTTLGGCWLLPPASRPHPRRKWDTCEPGRAVSQAARLQCLCTRAVRTPGNYSILRRRAVRTPGYSPYPLKRGTAMEEARRGTGLVS